MSQYDASLIVDREVVRVHSVLTIHRICFVNHRISFRMRFVVVEIRLEFVRIVRDNRFFSFVIVSYSSFNARINVSLYNCLASSAECCSSKTRKAAKANC